MLRITQEALLAAKQKLIDEKVSTLKTPQNSEYYYLSELGESDIYLKPEFIHYGRPLIEYKAEGLYNSTLENKQGSTTYKSSASIGEMAGYLVKESENWQSIPERHLSTIPTWVSNNEHNSHDADHFIIQDATPKLRGKIRRSGDPIKPEDLYSVKVLSKQIPERAVAYGVEWAQIIRRDTGEMIGEAYCYNNDAPVFDFLCDESKIGLDHSLSKATLAAQKEAAREAEKVQKQKEADVQKAKRDAAAAKKKTAKKKKRSKISFMDALAQVIAGILIAAVILAAEFVVILMVNKGVIDKRDPGIYSIDVENWDDYFFFTASNHTNQYREKAKEGKKRTASGRFYDCVSGEVPLLAVAPRASKFYIFDISETRGKMPKYTITDLYVKVKVTYSFNGVENYAIEEKYIESLSSNSDFITFPLPPESIQPSIFLGEPSGSFYADLDYWYFEVLEVSGTVEVKEGTK